ncbi:DUF3426 domain-containing protein [Bordetella genomosp. 10]|uniref:DUF3426 domain-containing protein n=1 Tax=Bordetella genomosp. 10 TaxID=1416804 RepID=UPI00403A2B77
MLRGRSDSWRQEPTLLSRDAPEDEDEPFDDDEDVHVARDFGDDKDVHGVRGLGGDKEAEDRGIVHGGKDDHGDPQVIRRRQRPVYVDPADERYDDDLHGHEIDEEDRRLESDNRDEADAGEAAQSWDRRAGRNERDEREERPARDEPDIRRDGGVYIYPPHDPRIGDDDADDGAYTPVRGEARTRYDDDVDAGMAPPVFMDETRLRRAALVRRLWALGCLLALCVLGLQWLYVYRSAVASAVPALRPALQAACGALGCEVGYPRRLERISITASSLQPPAGAAATDDGITRLVLNVTLRNRYDKPQPWPALVLELTDLSDTVVVRKILRPDDYLPTDASSAFPAGGEQTLSVPLRIAGAQVNGYQLDKFFP